MKIKDLDVYIRFSFQSFEEYMVGPAEKIYRKIVLFWPREEIVAETYLVWQLLGDAVSNPSPWNQLKISRFRNIIYHKLSNTNIIFFHLGKGPFFVGNNSSNFEGRYEYNIQGI